MQKFLCGQRFSVRHPKDFDDITVGAAAEVFFLEIKGFPSTRSFTCDLVVVRKRTSMGNRTEELLAVSMETIFVKSVLW